MGISHHNPKNLYRSSRWFLKSLLPIKYGKTYQQNLEYYMFNIIIIQIKRNLLNTPHFLNWTLLSLNLGKVHYRKKGCRKTERKEVRKYKSKETIKFI